MTIRKTIITKSTNLNNNKISMLEISTNLTILFAGFRLHLFGNKFLNHLATYQFSMSVLELPV